MSTTKLAQQNEAYKQYKEMKKLIVDEIGAGEKSQKVIEALHNLFRVSVPPRITHLFRDGNRQQNIRCDILFTFETDIIKGDEYYLRNELMEKGHHLNPSLIHEDLVIRMLRYEFWHSIYVNSRSESVIVAFPNTGVIKGGTWLNDSLFVIKHTLQDHGYLQPITRDGKYD